MATLYAFKNFNNYYNRKLKGQNILTIDDFISNYGDFEYMETGSYLNFNPNDGVRTSQVLGRPGYVNYNGNCDYIVYCEDNINITSRWFIVEQPRKMVGQYTLSLKRDSIADNWDVIKNSPMFIEKATLDNTNPLIYNDENISVNQIKTNEFLIKDLTNCPWIVGFYAANKEITEENFTPKFNFDHSTTDKTAWCQNLSKNYTPQDLNDFNIAIHYYEDWGGLGRIPSYYRAITDSSYSDAQLYDTGFHYGRNQSGNFIASTYTQNILTTQVRTKINVATNAEAQAILAYNGDVLYDSTLHKYFRIRVTYNTTNYTAHHTYLNSSDYLYTYLNDSITTACPGIQGSPDEYSYSIDYRYYTLEVSANEELYTNQTITYSLTNGYTLQDQPYNAFCMPYGNIGLIHNGNEITSNKELNFQIANLINNTSDVYDVQIIPYCPLSNEFITNQGKIDSGTDNILAHPIVRDKTGVNETIGYIYSMTVSSFARHINLPNPITISNKKLENQCDMYRLCSPGYSSVYEINLAKNNGLSGVNLSITLKPYNSYILVSPDFQGLYGTNFNDGRGLIINDNLSITKYTELFEEYELQNKNYQEIFNRQIENMEVQYKYQNIENAVSGTLGALSAGATAGMLTGNAAIGATAGIASGIGAIADIGIAKALQSEAIDYTKDQFGYELDNIKARPNTISKTTAFNINNKWFPYIEYYTCTDEEKKALANKIAYNGMTVGVIGYIKDYIDNTWSWENITDKGYIKGRIIRLEGIAEDSHLLNDIAEELNKGVYTK